MLLALSLDVTRYVSGHWWAYGVVFGACLLDSILFFLVPSEAVTIAAGILAADGKLAIWLVLPVAAAGVFSGDNAAYAIGRLVGEPFARRVRSRERGRRWLDEGRRLIGRHGETIVLAGRFVPAGRTAATITAGMGELPWRRFARADAPAAVLWAVYASMLGYLGGHAFEHSFWKPFVIALGVAVLVAGAGEGWRRFQGSRGRDVLGEELEPDRQERSTGRPRSSHSLHEPG